MSRPTPDTLNNRFSTILKHFPSAMGVDDFIARTEVALCYFGFTGDNTIGETQHPQDLLSPRMQPETCLLSVLCSLSATP